MKIKKHTKASLFPLLIALAVVGVVFGIIFFQAQKTQQTQSQASYNIFQECRSQICNQLDENLKRKCVINCQLLHQGKIKCPKFCDPYAPATDLCLETCYAIANPCTVQNGVCAEAKQYGKECKASCLTVQNRGKTCDDAFTNNPDWDSIKNMNPAYSQIFKATVIRCKTAFE